MKRDVIQETQMDSKDNTAGLFKKLHKEFLSYKNPIRAKAVASFFKTGKGEYGYGDVFLGLTVPEVRSLAKQYQACSFEDIEKLLHSKWHEERLCAVILLSEKAKKESLLRKDICNLYLTHSKYINNWDLVDVSSEYCVGLYLMTLSVPAQKKFLMPLITSSNLWERRIAMIATFASIKQGISGVALFVAEKLLNDSHDLIHKAVGWMLREVGKRASNQELLSFLSLYGGVMPRTTLRYALERQDPETRRYYMNLKKR